MGVQVSDKASQELMDETRGTVDDQKRRGVERKKVQEEAHAILKF
jgi:hypothetical protein